MTRQIGFPKHQAVEAVFAPKPFLPYQERSACFVLVFIPKSQWIWVGGNPFFFQNTNAGPDKTSHCPGVCDHRSGGAAPVRSKCHGTIWETFRRLEYGNTSKYIIYIEFHFFIIVIWLQYTSYHFMYVSSTPFFFLRRTASTAFRSQVKDFRQTGEGFARRWGSRVEQWNYMDLPPRN